MDKNIARLRRAKTTRSHIREHASPGAAGLRMCVDELVEAAKVAQPAKKRLALEKLIYGREPDGS